ncbi:DNA polymerase III subunit alpha [Streptococcus sp. sy004]|uniref:DNA polymerase III subunit alpha n=1 Tax=Streptococcus sp. sy004 TaxID=2600149 RepID=UPI0011B4123C|nr:DNA polymerase III subunit alpha [Streptococcus sp. sy004]TWT12166.1 DNA polymerase III subunit alpha [Streptococcus sp. sy004]
MFVQLDTKTVYSFMDSLIDLKGYLTRAKELGYQQVGIMDKSNLYGAYPFMQEAKKLGLSPIIGMEADVTIEGRQCAVYLLARNTRGYHRLLKLATQVMTSGLTQEDLVTDLKGLTLIIPYFEGIEQLELPFDYMIGVFLDSPQLVYPKPIIPLQTVRYYQESEMEVLQVLHAIRDNSSLAQAGSVQAGQVLLSAQELTEHFQERFPESLVNLKGLVTGISYQLNDHLKLPRFNQQVPAHQELRQEAELGLKAKQLWQPVYQERLDKELSVIHKMGFDDYFLIVWDLLRFGRRQKYYMGMGRGSAAGSLVAYALDITGIDPVKNQLLFERFLNEERYSMPDIDIDIPDIHRNAFLHYVKERYGQEHVAQIVTFSTFGAKQALRDVFKRFGASEYDLTVLSKKIRFKDTLSLVYQNNLSFRQLILEKKEYQKAFAIAKRIEGQPRQTSIHAAGIVMSDDELTNHIPLKSGDEMMITQFDANSVEANGLLKMDFLGLRNLTFAQKMAEEVKRRYGQEIKIASIDLEDSKTLQLFAQGQTKGIFQFEKSGAINLLKQVKPHCFEEIVATTSLNRPGASDYISNFVKRKFGQERVETLSPEIDPILQSTYGIMLYQEQVMQIAQVYAGFSLGKADLLRRAMSKKNQREMAAMASEFLTGAITKGHDQQTAQAIFERMAKFAGYGFNRSHAYAYSALAFQLAYFKAHYPDAFYHIMLNYSNSDYIRDALQQGFSLAPISINDISEYDTVTDGRIYLGLKRIKGLGQDLSQWLYANRPFTSVEDFLMRLPESYHKIDLLETITKAGLFDDLEPNRQKILQNLPSLLNFVTQLGSLFAQSSYHWTEANDFSSQEKYEMEQEILGVGVSPHPVFQILREQAGHYIPFDDLVNETTVTVLGQIESIREIRTKTTGQLMAFVGLTDGVKRLDVTIFPNDYQRLAQQLEKGKIVYIKGKVQERQERLQLIAQLVSPVITEKFWIQLANHDHDREISAILAQYPGDFPVILRYEEEKETLRSRNYRVSKSKEMEEKLKTYVMKTIFH